MNSWIGWLWRCLVRTYPADFRYEFGPDLVDALRTQTLELRGSARLQFCIHAAADVLVTAFKERYYMMLDDFKQSYRRFVAHPGVAAVAILSLALGIGANTAMFSIIYAALLRPLPYPESERRVIVRSFALDSRNRQNRGGATSADFIDWARQSKTLTDWHMFVRPTPNTVVGLGLPERVVTQAVTPGLLDALGARPIAGRFFQSDSEGGARPTVISESYWERKFNREMSAVGRTMTIDGDLRVIVGVAGSGFELFDEHARVDIWVAIDLSPGSVWVQRSLPWITATARLKPGVSMEQAQSEMTGIAAGLAQMYPDTNRNRGVVLVPMQEDRNGSLGSILYPLFGAVAFVLLIACANVANLLLARATARQREISVRAALGAGRARLIREFLADGLVLAIPGVAAGLALAHLGIRLFRASVPQGFPGSEAVELNTPVLLFTAAAAMTAGIISAIFPAVSASRVDLTESLKEGARGSAGRRRHRLRSVLVASEIALAVVLLVGAGLMLASVARMQNFVLGFDSRNVTVAQMDLSGKRYKSFAPMQAIDMRNVEPAVAQFMEHVLRSVRAIPGVTHVALAGSVPMGPAAAPGARIRMPGALEPDPRRVESNAITGGFFEALRIPLKQGRYLKDSDTEPGVWVAVVNETFVREFFPDGKALGKEITLVAGPGERPRQIVGIVADYIQFSPRVPIQPEVFTSYFQQTRVIPGNYQGQRFRPRLIVRSQTAGAVRAEAIAKVIADFDSEVAPFDFRPLDWHIVTRGGPMRFYANMLALFSTIALLLATIGIYGLMSYSVTDRYHEIGIRLSLGAARSNIVWLIVRHALTLSAAGLMVGIAGALVMTRALNALLFGVKAWDPATFVSVTLFLLGVAIAASAIPALRATAVNALVALRQE